MPSAMRYIAPTDTKRSSFSPALVNEYKKRRDFYVTSLQYYEGVVTPPFEVDDDDPDYDPTVDNTVVNLVKMAADRTASFLFPDVPRIQTDPSNIEDTEEEIWLKKFLESNGGLQALIKWALRGFLSGHTFIWVKKKKPYPKMVVLHPLSITAFWKADDVSEILWYEQRFFNDGVIYIRDFIKKDDDTWHIILYKSKASEQLREEIIIDQLSSQGNTFAELNYDTAPYGNGFTVEEIVPHGSITPPIVGTPHLPHPDSFYGLGEFTEQDLLDIINKVASERTRIVRQNADPVDIITGASIDEVEGDGNVVAIPSATARHTRAQLSSDLHAVNTTLDHLIEQFLGIMRVVILKGEAKDLQRVTNAAVRTLFLDALAKNEILWASYKHTLVSVFRLALEYAYADNLLPIANPQEVDIVLTMKSPLPVDKTEIANINALAINAGYMSLITAATELGLDYAFEKIAVETEFAEGLERQEQTLALAASFAPDPNEVKQQGSNAPEKGEKGGKDDKAPSK